MANNKRIRTNESIDGNLDVGGALTVTGAVSGASSSRPVTTTDTATSADNILILSGASFTQNLYTAVGNVGRVLRIIHNGTSVTQVYTIDANGAQTIDGQLTYSLYTNGETLEIVSDGANWVVLNHKSITPWTAFTGTSTWNTGITSNTGFWRRVGENIEVDQTIVASGVVTAAQLRHTVPLSLVIDAAKLSNPVPSEQQVVGIGQASDFATNGFQVQCIYFSTTQITVYSQLTTGTYAALSGVDNVQPFTWGAGDSVQTKYSVPIVGWRA